MTTIVYDHKNKQIACDSRMAKSSGSYSDCFIKMVHNKSRLFAMSGSTCDIDYFIELDCSGIMIENRKAYSVFTHEGVFYLDLLFCNESEGSGGRYGLAALDFGESAKGAVEYAATKDCFTGGMAHVYDIEKGDFI